MPAEPDIRLDVAPMPPRSRCHGFEFIEFTSNEQEAEGLAATLQALGFELAGHHVSKKVARWCQGDINILVNTEETGFAHSAYQAHGTSVCDMALRVDNASDTIARAGELGAEMVKTAAIAGELSIPAIKGVGGGIVHFVDDESELATLWDVDFTPVNGTTTFEGVGLRSVDHLAQTMKYEEMLTWTLFYTTIFDVDKVAMVDVVDPGGLIRSRAIQNTSGKLRITLNGAENQKTLAGRFISQTFGATVQHIAFGCEDIFVTAQQLGVWL